MKLPLVFIFLDFVYKCLVFLRKKNKLLLDSPPSIMYCFLAKAPQLSCSSLAAFKIFLFTGFQQFDYDVHNQKLVVFLIVLLLAVCWAPWICELMVFFKFRKFFSPYFFKDFFLCLPYCFELSHLDLKSSWNWFLVYGVR